METSSGSRAVCLCVGVLLCYVTGPGTSLGEASASGRGSGNGAVIKELVVTTNKFCFEHVKDATKFCIFIQRYSASWDEAQEACADWGGRLPEPHVGHPGMDEGLPIDEGDSAFLISQMIQQDGMWIGGRGDPTDMDIQGESDSEIWNLWDSPGPKRHHLECNHIDCGCATLSEGQDEVQQGQCSCFKPLPFICVAKTDSTTTLCPEGFSHCPGNRESVCYKIGDPAANWFRANEFCITLKAKLPDFSNSSNGAIEAALHCMRDNKPGGGLRESEFEGDDFGRPIHPPSPRSPHSEITWTIDEGIWWIWNSTGEIIRKTKWDSKQPGCPLGECLVIESNGAWSTENCDFKRNFTCVKVNATCEDCVIRTYGESNHDVTKSLPTTQPDSVPAATMNRWTIAVTVLGAGVLLIIVSLVVIIIKIKRERARDLAAQLAEHEALYAHLSARNNSIYENDVPGLEVYTELSPHEPDPSIYSFIGDVEDAGNSQPAATTFDEANLSKYRLNPRKGSLPATPDLIPLSMRKYDRHAQMPNRKISEQKYLELFAAPYKDIIAQRRQGGEGGVSCTLAEVEENLEETTEELYADKPQLAEDNSISKRYDVDDADEDTDEPRHIVKNTHSKRYEAEGVDGYPGKARLTEENTFSKGCDGEDVDEAQLPEEITITKGYDGDDDGDADKPGLTDENGISKECDREDVDEDTDKQGLTEESTFSMGHDGKDADGDTDKPCLIGASTLCKGDDGEDVDEDTDKTGLTEENGFSKGYHGEDVVQDRDEPQLPVENTFPKGYNGDDVDDDVTSELYDAPHAYSTGAMRVDEGQMDDENIQSDTCDSGRQTIVVKPDRLDSDVCQEV